MPQKRSHTSPIVYSTDRSFNFPAEENESVSILPSDQHLHVKLDKKQRGGKIVTIIEGYRGEGIDEVGKQLKKYCGTGGSVKDGIIIVQGDNREKMFAWLLKNGYKHVKRS